MGRGRAAKGTERTHVRSMWVRAAFRVQNLRTGRNPESKERSVSSRGLLMTTSEVRIISVVTVRQLTCRADVTPNSPPREKVFPSFRVAASESL